MPVSNTQERADREKDKPTQVFSSADLDEADRISEALARQRRMDEQARVEFFPKIFLQYFDEYGEPQEDVSWCQDRVHDTDVEYTISEDRNVEGYLFLGKGAHGGENVD